MLTSFREKINREKDTRIRKKQELATCRKSLRIAERNLSDHRKVLESFKQAALYTQNYLETHLSNIVTKALRAVFFEKDVQFKVEFVERRNTSECDMFLIEDGEEYDLLDDRGHGMADIASMALRVAYILLDNVSNVLVMDEPFRNLSKKRQPYASKMIKELSRELDMQFIIATHITHLVDYADCHLQTSFHKKGSMVKECNE